MPALVIAPPAPRLGAPGVLWIHGGGYITGMKEMVYMSRAADLLRCCGVTVFSPEKRKNKSKRAYKENCSFHLILPFSRDATVKRESSMSAPS